MSKKVLVTGGAGYVGSVLAPELVKKGYKVVVFDSFWFWDSTEEFVSKIGLGGNSDIEAIKGDIRDKDAVCKAAEGCDAVIHLACISNDPSSELNEQFTHEVNYDGSVNVVDCAFVNKVERFIYASSSSVYGIKDTPNVTEDLPLEPLTQYSKLKVEIEHYVLHKFRQGLNAVIVRPSTVCGYSPRQRLDVVVNILTNLAVNKGKIKIFGGEQLRPNIHIADMVACYLLLLEAPIDKIRGKTFNAGYENLKVKEIASAVKEVVGDVETETVPSDDMRSYHVNSEKIKDELGFANAHTVKEAVADLKKAFADGKIPDIDDDRYYNVKRMNRLLKEGLN